MGQWDDLSEMPQGHSLDDCQEGRERQRIGMRKYYERRSDDGTAKKFAKKAAMSKALKYSSPPTIKKFSWEKE